MKRQYSQPLVSVIMPAYNAEQFVEEAVLSIVNQTYKNIELVVVDDGSKDGTWNVLTKLQHKYPSILRIYQLKQNRGESFAANTAIIKSRGEFIARMDADDISNKLRIEKQVKFLLSHPEVIIVGSQAHVVDTNGKKIGYKKAPITHDEIYKSFASFNPMVHPSVMYRKDLLPRQSNLYHNRFETTDDYHTYFELLKYGKFANLPQTLVSYRIHGSNKSLINMKEKFWTDTKVRITAIKDYQYKAPWIMFPTIAVQAIIVLLLPEVLLRELFFYLRGIKKLPIRLPDFSPKNARGTMKPYAVSS